MKDDFFGNLKLDLIGVFFDFRKPDDDKSL